MSATISSTGFGCTRSGDTLIVLDRVEVLVGLFHRLPPGGGVSLVGRLDCHCQDCTAVQGYRRFACGFAGRG